MVLIMFLSLLSILSLNPDQEYTLSVWSLTIFLHSQIIFLVIHFLSTNHNCFKKVWVLCSVLLHCPELSCCCLVFQMHLCPFICSCTKVIHSNEWKKRKTDIFGCSYYFTVLKWPTQLQIYLTGNKTPCSVTRFGCHSLSGKVCWHVRLSHGTRGDFRSLFVCQTSKPVCPGQRLLDKF